LETATRELLAGSQQDFPVLAGGNVTGILRRNDLVQALSQGQRQASVGDVMCRKCEVVTASDPLERTLERMHQEGCSTLAVIENGELVGLLTLENIGELVMIKAAAS
jgi:predicted transcriptional regulator